MKYLIINTESFQTGEVPEVVKKFITRHRKPFIVLDESSKIKSNNACRVDKKSKRTLAIQKLNKFGHRAILTGTFISKSPVNAYDQMEFLKKDYFHENIFSFEGRYCIKVFLPIGRGRQVLISEDIYEQLHKSLNKTFLARGQAALESLMEVYLKRFRISERNQLFIMNHKKYTPFKNMKDLYERVKDDVMIVKKKDALDLPPKVYEMIRIEPTEEMRTLYKRLLKEGFTDDVVAPSGISLYHRFQDVCNGYIPVQEDEDDPVTLIPQKENPKLDAMLEKIEEINTDTNQVVVWSNRKLFLNDAAAVLRNAGYNCCVYDGTTKDAEKKSIEEQFKAKKIQVFLGNTSSGAYGLDFLKAANYEIFICNDYSTEIREQAEDRLHRGTESDVKNVIDIVVAGTVDEKVVKSLKLGKELIHSGKTDKAVFELEEIEWTAL
jgi:SNF2 family DNA or RNA helicase